MKQKIIDHFQGTFESFYGKYLQKQKQLKGDEFQALCPFHSETNPSLSFNNLTGLFKCFGCGEAGDAFSFYAKLKHLDTNQDFPKILSGIAGDFGISNGHQEGYEKRKPDATYNYVDAKGQVTCRKCKLIVPDGHNITWWESPNGNGKWIRGLNGIEPGLYNRSDVIKAGKIWIVEGEKDVETAKTLDSTATTSPHGAGSWKNEYADHLKGKDIVLIPDNDNPGREHMEKVAKSLNGVANSIVWIELPGIEKIDGGDLSDWVAKQTNKKMAKGHLDLLIREADLYEPQPEIKKEQEPGEEGSQSKKISMAVVVVEIAKNFDLFHTDGDEIYAQYRANGHRELWNIRNKKFKNHISNIAYDTEGRMPSENAIRDALNVIEGIARFTRDIRIEVHTRIARVNDTIYIYMVNDQWEVVEINKDGWDVIKTSPIYFERTKGMLPLPYPVPGGKISDLKELLNLPDDNDATWILIVSWVLQAMNDIGSYPILIVNGEQGSAKSTLSKLIRSIVDPNQADLRSLPRNEHDIVIAAKNGWVLGFDNLSGMQNWLSDALCRISTGAGFATRKLYSDNEEEIFYSRKPIILNGINSLVRRNDLADRALLISLPPIEGEGNIKESVLQKHFCGNLPSILGGFYSAVAEGLKNKDMEFNNLPRMADFADWIQKAEPALPWAKGRFIETYQENRTSIIEESINQDLVGSAIKNWVDSWIMQTEWEGSTSDLLGILEGITGDNTIRSKGWPQDASSLSRRINSQTKFLRQTGIEVEKLTRNSKGQPLKIKNLQYMKSQKSSVGIV